MCGRLNITDDPWVTQILLDFGIENPYEPRHLGRFIRATQEISIVLEEKVKATTGPMTQRRVQSAAWWLLQEATANGFQPSRYTSFNSRYDKLFVPSSAAYHPFQSSRCIIIANGFGETQETGKVKRYFDFRTAHEPILFAGLYRIWQHTHQHAPFYSCSIITLPPHPKLQCYHDKASPMMLPNDRDLIDAWLDPDFHHVEAFRPLLMPSLYQPLWVQEVDKPSTYQPIGAEHCIPSDN
ncbi:SOS response-associated peptidase family protein [Pseudoalteromonas xiamenensis]|uniref:Abasic site processing protein n=1 Tax=Pseudoalteromonas xiamenensis TaxID=882626 RepID=A0A975HNC6_9GAMM|nr:SOS response-associated peptidase family protein [Pseudoalteromonas xiamenensis]QTH72070.1 SOS response-associated peptidase family protein [Pseudoalteromonas xiamenensis]